MKNIISAVTISACCLITITACGQKVDAPIAVKSSFYNHFKDVQTSRWTKTFGAYVSTFTQGGDYRDAYFTSEGEFRGVGRFITLEFLPMMIKEKLDKEFSKYGILELYQYDCIQEGLCFYAVLKNSKYELILKMDPNGEIVFSRKSRIKTEGDNSHTAVVKDFTKEAIVSN